jgi:xanthine dehydrogenase YagT iron-sulfur-binding subunit
MSRTLSRRSFLQDTVLMSAEVFVAGVTPVNAAVLPGTAQGAAGASATSASAAAVGRDARGGVAAAPSPVALTLRVNGIERTLHAEPRMTLAEALRGPLGLTGTKIACNRGACSACTVWLDGVPVCSCMMLAVDAEKHSVTTIEGLAKGETLHPVQAAFIEHDALQCGFCTPGMVMSCAALFEHTPNPTAENIKAAISGHYCRCGTYPHVIAAMLAVGAARKGR